MHLYCSTIWFSASALPSWTLVYRYSTARCMHMSVCSNLGIICKCWAKQKEEEEKNLIPFISHLKVLGSALGKHTQYVFYKVKGNNCKTLTTVKCLSMSIFCCLSDITNICDLSLSVHLCISLSLSLSRMTIDLLSLFPHLAHLHSLEMYHSC